MGYEQSVREKHKFEKAVRDFFKYASVMTDEEIELCMGRIADKITSSDSASIKQHLSIKGALLKKYLECRLLGLIKQSRLKRVLYRGEMKDFFVNKGRNIHFLAIESYEYQVSQSKKQHEARMNEYKSNYKIWQKTLSDWFKRLSGPIPDQPKRPELPAIKKPDDVEKFVERSMLRANMSDFLIATTCDFNLINIPQTVEHYSPNDIKKLGSE